MLLLGISAKSKNILLNSLSRTGDNNSAAVGWGRGMGHKGHMFLASSVITHAKQHNADPYFVVSRTVGKNDPFIPSEKLAIYKKVFPENRHIFQFATNEMPDLTSVLVNLYKQGYKMVTVIVGADQKDAFGYVTNYNGKPTKSGEILFNFDDLNVISRQETADPSAGKEGPRSTLMRKVLNDTSKTADEQFAVWRNAMHSEISSSEVKKLMIKAKTRLDAFSISDAKVKKYV